MLSVLCFCVCGFLCEFFFFSVTYLLSVICYLGIGIRRSGRRDGEGDDKKLNCDREEGTHQSFRRVKTLDTPWRKPTARDYPPRIAAETRESESCCPPDTYAALATGGMMQGVVTARRGQTVNGAPPWPTRQPLLGVLVT